MTMEIHTDFFYARHEQRFETVTLHASRQALSRIVHWQPDPDQEQHPYVPDIPFEDGWVDLRDLNKSQGLNVLVHGAEFTFKRADEDNVKLWTSHGTVHNRWLPFIGQIARTGTYNAVAYYNPGTQEEHFYPGIIATRSANLRASIDMPHYDYDQQGRLLPPRHPDDYRSGAVLGLRVFNLIQE